MKAFIRKHQQIISLLLTFGALRLSFIAKGHFFWIDELRFTNAFLFYDALGQGDIKQAGWYLFHAHGRPGFVLLSAIPAGIQLLLQKIGVISLESPQFMELLRRDQMTTGFNPHFFDVCGIFNILAGLAAALLFFKILELFTNHKELPYIGVIIYSALVNTNFYIRHLVPYGMSLLFFLFPLYCVLKGIARKSLNKKGAVASGILSAFAFSVYPSYYLFVFMIAALFLLSPRGKITGFALHIFSFAVFTGLVESLSRWIGNSYIGSLRELSAIAIQGTFAEGYIFPLRYLISVEGITGIALIVLFFLFLGVVLRRSPAAVKAIYLTVAAGYFYHATSGVIFKKVVFYGRVLHMYFPFLVLAAVIFLDSIRNHRLRRRLSILMAAVAVIGFISFLKQYIPLNYPLDFRRDNISRLPPGAVYSANEQVLPDRSRIQNAQGVLVNAEYFHPIWPEWYPLETPSGMKLAAAAVHPLHFPAYQFEGHSLEDRQRLQQRKIIMRFYVKEYLYDAFKK